MRETLSERDPQSALTRLEVMEDELVGKQQEIEELNRELEEMRAAYGTEGLQQVREKLYLYPTDSLTATSSLDFMPSVLTGEEESRTMWYMQLPASSCQM